MGEAAWHKIPLALEMVAPVQELCEDLHNPLAGMYLIRLWRFAKIDPTNNARFTGPGRVGAVELLVGYRGKRGRFVEAARKRFLREEGEALVVVPWQEVIRSEWITAANEERTEPTEETTPTAAAQPSRRKGKSNAERQKEYRDNQKKLKTERNGEAVTESVTSNGLTVTPVTERNVTSNGPSVTESVTSPVTVGGKGGDLSPSVETEKEKETQKERENPAPARDAQPVAVTAQAPTGSLKPLDGGGQRANESPRSAGPATVTGDPPAKPARQRNVPLPNEETTAVFSHYKRTCDPGATGHIRRHETIWAALCLSPDYTAESLKQSITGKRRDPFHNGKKDGQPKLRLDVLLKDSENIDEGLRLYRVQEGLPVLGTVEGESDPTAEPAKAPYHAEWKPPEEQQEKPEDRKAIAEEARSLLKGLGQAGGPTRHRKHTAESHP